MTMSMGPVRQQPPIILVICGMVVAAVPVVQTGDRPRPRGRNDCVPGLGAAHLIPLFAMRIALSNSSCGSTSVVF